MDDKFFKASIISSGLYVLNLGIEKEDTVDISIYALQVLLNAIGIRASMDYFDRVFSLVVHAYLNYPKNLKI